MLALLGIALWSATALAFTPSGYGVPVLGGGLAGVEQDGPAGLFYNPAAAHPDRGAVLVDIGWMYSDISYTLDLDENFALHSKVGSVAPSFALAEPVVGPIGLGLSFLPLYVRGGGPGADPTGAQRFHSITGGIQLLEFDFSAAVAVHRSWTLGAALRVGAAKLSSYRALDSGALIGSLAEDVDVPVGDPFLEGTMELDGHHGQGFGGTWGLHYAPDHGTGLSLSVRSSMLVKVTGPLSIVPSNFLAAEITARADTELPFPPAAFLAVDIPIGRTRFVPDLWWVGWGSYYSFETVLSDIQLSSDSGPLQALLESYGLTEVDFLEGSAKSVNTSGMHDVLTLGGSVWLPCGDRWMTRYGIWYTPAAVPDAAVHPGDLDFDTVDLRAVTAWNATTWLKLGLSGDWFWAPRRVITTSAHSLVDPQAPGSLLPSGNGTYALSLARLGLTAVISHRAAGGRSSL